MIATLGVLRPPRERPRRVRHMLGEGEGLELIAVFVTVMTSLAVLVLLGKWWEA
jgi:hypothetical protein